MDIAEIDEKGRGLLFFGNGTVTECSAVAGQDNVFLLETEIVLERAQQLTAVPGQVYFFCRKFGAVLPPHKCLQKRSKRNKK